jgi:hypothetical protein
MELNCERELTQNEEKNLVVCKDYNGFKNVFFVLDLEDDRIESPNWVFISKVEIDLDKSFEYNGNQYIVYEDCSVTKI